MFCFNLLRSRTVWLSRRMPFLRHCRRSGCTGSRRGRSRGIFQSSILTFFEWSVSSYGANNVFRRRRIWRKSVVLWLDVTLGILLGGRVNHLLEALLLLSSSKVLSTLSLVTVVGQIGNWLFGGWKSLT